jgi:hypothetical protein
LLEIPAIHCAAHIVGDLPDLALQCGALLGAGHCVVLFEYVLNSDLFISSLAL